MSKHELTGVNDMQMTMPMMGEIDTSIVDAPRDLVALCRTKADAYRLTMNLARVRRQDRDWAELLGLKAPHLSQILNPQLKMPKYMPPEAESALIRIAGNTAPTQWTNMHAKNELVHQKTTEALKAELRAQLAELEALERTA